MKILITGASGGIGYAVGKKLLERGHLVVFATHTVQEKERLLREGLDSLVVDYLDLNDFSFLKGIDVLFCNAAIGEGGSIIDIPIEKIRHNFDVNVFGTCQLVQEALKGMVERNHGTVVIMSSLVADMPIAFLGSYCATKAALKSLAINLKKELSYLTDDVHIKLIQPGAFHTGFNQLMIDKNLDFRQPHYQKQLKDQVEWMHTKFTIIESKILDSIVRLIVRAIESKSKRFLYKAPMMQSVLTKLYMIFCK